MTTWEWSVVMALVRCILAMSGYKFPGCEDENLGRRDAKILVEAIEREALRETFGRGVEESLDN